MAFFAIFANGLPYHAVLVTLDHTGKVMTGKISLCRMAIQLR
jgi:hypothetical protein